MGPLNNFSYHFFSMYPPVVRMSGDKRRLTHTPGKRITLEHTLRHHFRTQPFCITLEHKIKHLMETPPYTHIRFTDRRETLEEKRVPKRDQHKKPSSYENLTRFNHVTKSHACHVKGQSMYKSATPATQNEGRCQKVPRLPQKMKVNI